MDDMPLFPPCDGPDVKALHASICDHAGTSAAHLSPALLRPQGAVGFFRLRHRRLKAIGSCVWHCSFGVRQEPSELFKLRRAAPPLQGVIPRAVGGRVPRPSTLRLAGELIGATRPGASSAESRVEIERCCSRD